MKKSSPLWFVASLLVSSMGLTAASAQEVSISSSATHAVGDLQCPEVTLTTLLQGVQNVALHTLTTAEAQAVRTQFKLSPQTCHAVVGFKYEIKDSQGGKESGFHWAKAVSSPTRESIFSALSGLGQKDLQALADGYKKRLQEKLNPVTEAPRNTPVTQTQTQPSPPVPAQKPVTKPVQKTKPAQTQPAQVVPVRVVILGEDWCGYCRQLKACVPDLQKEYKGRGIIEYIDMKQNPAARSQYEARTVPTVVAFQGDKKVQHLNGSPGCDGIKQLLNGQY